MLLGAGLGHLQKYYQTIVLNHKPTAPTYVCLTEFIIHYAVYLSGLNTTFGEKCFQLVSTP